MEVIFNSVLPYYFLKKNFAVILAKVTNSHFYKVQLNV